MEVESKREVEKNHVIQEGTLEAGSITEQNDEPKEGISGVRNVPREGVPGAWNVTEQNPVLREEIPGVRSVM